MISRIPALFCALVAGFGVAPTAMGAPQTFNTALPIAQDEFVFREQFVYHKATDDPGPADRKLQVLGGVSVLGYGVTGDVAVFGVLPYLDKELDVTTPGGRVTRDTSGIADVRLFGRYTVYKDDAPGRTFRIAPFLGVELPTGDDSDRDSLGSLPAPLQLGSGSWDGFGGIVLTYQTLHYQIDAQASYTLNTEANNVEFGDQAGLDASLQYRVWPKALDAGIPGFLYAVLEANLLYTDNNEIKGVRDPDSGGTAFFLSPGIQYVTKRWIIEGIVQLPVSQNLNGAALEDDFTVRAGFRFNF
tara:strand:+ start:411 stop:1313 length:903 start_codon:yes stop_codon:yes gene_type:complete